MKTHEAKRVSMSLLPLRLVGNLGNRPSPGAAVTSLDPTRQSERVPVDMGTGRMFLVGAGRWREERWSTQQ